MFTQKKVFYSLSRFRPPKGRTTYKARLQNKQHPFLTQRIRNLRERQGERETGREGDKGSGGQGEL